MLLNKSKTRRVITLGLFLSFFIGTQAQSMQLRLNVPVISQFCFSSYDYASGKYGFVDINGNTVISPQFDNVRVFSEFYNTGPFYLNSENVYYKQQKLVYKQYVEETISYLLYHAAVEINGTWGFVDLITGQLFNFPYNFTDIDLVNDGAVVYPYSKDAYHVIDNLFAYGVNNSSYVLIYFSQETSQRMRSDDPYIHNLIVDEMQRQSYKFDSLELEDGILLDNSNSTGSSYNVNVFDSMGKWYETGLLIMSNDRLYIKLIEGQFELVQSDDKNYRYVLKGKRLYVK